MGHFCPQGTAEPQPCPEGTYSNKTKLVKLVRNVSLRMCINTRLTTVPSFGSMC